MPIGEELEIKPSFKTMIESNPALLTWLDNDGKLKYFADDFNELRKYFGLLQYDAKIHHDVLKDAYIVDINRKKKFVATLEFKSITPNTAIDVMNFIMNNFLTFKDYNTIIKRQERNEVRK